MLRILNLRRGFATNSSSSHSILLLPNKQFKPRQISESETGAFHGEDFTLTDSQSKQRYLSALLLNSLREMSADMKKTILSDWVSDEYAALAVDHDYQIDHDSVFYIPMDYGTKSPSKQLWDEIKTFVLRDDVVILGGYNGSHPLSEMDNGRYMYLDNVLSSSRMDGDTVCRKDPKYNFWTVFNTRNGAKIRFVLEDLLNDNDSYYFDYKDKYTKSYTPELVDMGITSWCDIGCEYCVTGSTLIKMFDNTMKKIEDVVVGDIIQTINMDNGDIENMPVSQKHVRDYNNIIMVIKFENGEILEITPNHEIFTQRGWIAAECLCTDDEVLDWRENVLIVESQINQLGQELAVKTNV